MLFFQQKTLNVLKKENIPATTNPTDRIVPVVDFIEFNEHSQKLRNFKIRDLFLRQLLQLKTLSLDKAMAILKYYPTPRSLLVAYENCISEQDGEKLLANIEFGKLKKTIGPMISKTIFQLYNSKQPS